MRKFLSPGLGKCTLSLPPPPFLSSSSFLCSLFFVRSTFLRLFHSLLKYAEGSNGRRCVCWTAFWSIRHFGGLSVRSLFTFGHSHLSFAYVHLIHLLIFRHFSVTYGHSYHRKFVFVVSARMHTSVFSVHPI